MISRYKIPKLASKLLGHLILSGLIAVFTYDFLYTTSYGLAQKLAFKGEYGDVDYAVLEVIELTCFIGAAVVFFVMFLYLVGQKLSYILEINQAISQLEGGNLGYRVAVEKDDELSELAASLNHLGETLQAYRQNEERLELERTALIQSLSHDIRTPLTAIISYTDFIKENRYDSPEKLESYIHIIQSKAYQIKELAQMLLDTKETANAVDEKDTCDGKLLITQLIQEYEAILEDEGFGVEIQIEELGHFITKIQPQDLVRVFDNLCSNIIKYAEPSQKVILNIQLEAKVLTIILRNTIKMEKSKSVDSYGIGLKNIRQIANKYEGNIEVYTTDTKYTMKMNFHI